MKRAWLLLVPLIWGTPIRAQEAPPPVTVTLSGARLSVNAQEASLQHILAELSRVSGIQIYLEVALEPQVGKEATTVTFETPTIEEGLRRLLRNKNFILVYSPAGLAEVRVYVEGRGEFRRVEAEPRQAPRRVAAVAPRADRPPRATADPATLAKLRGEALANPDPAERSTALEKLAGSDDQKLAQETALDVLERERDSEVLESALDLLTGQESVARLDPVLKFATSDRDPNLRIHALEILGEHGKRDPRVSELLKTLARSERNEEVRETARSLLNDLEE